MNVVDVASLHRVPMDVVFDLLKQEGESNESVLARVLGGERSTLSTAPRGEWRPWVYEVETLIHGARIAYHDQRTYVLSEWMYTTNAEAIAGLADFLVLRLRVVERARKYATKPMHFPDEPRGWVRSTHRPRALAPFRRREYTNEGEGTVVREWASG